jgi:hypothetical protein
MSFFSKCGMEISRERLQTEESARLFMEAEKQWLICFAG